LNGERATDAYQLGCHFKRYTPKNYGLLLCF